jgi:hypothetical protein
MTNNTVLQLLATILGILAEAFSSAREAVEDAISEAGEFAEETPANNQFASVNGAVSAYGGEINVPDGYEPTGEFRVPGYGELYLTLHSQSVGHGPGTAYGGPRLILRKVAAAAPMFPAGVSDVYANPPVIPAGYVWTGAFRTATEGELYLGINQQKVKSVIYGKTAGPRLILKAA